MSNYEVDEYYDPEPEIIGTSYSNWLYKAPNGHLIYETVILTRWTGQDWGECDADSKYTNLNDLKPLSKANAIALGLRMQPGQACEWAWLHMSHWIMFLTEPLPANWQQSYSDYVSGYGDW